MAREGRFAKGAARREAILTTAMDVLARDGYRGTSLRSIARALELEPAHILYYFDSREDLLQNVIERWDADNTAAWGGDPTPANTLDLYADAIRRNLEIPGLVHLYLIFAAEAAQPDHPSHQFFRDRFEQLRRLLGVAIGYEQGAGRIDMSVDADRAARLLIAVADGVQLQALVDPTIDAPKDLAATIAQLRGETASRI
ncbi:MAG: TetR/AcrR family transcriptional regulator [Microbacterium sp.]